MSELDVFESACNEGAGVHDVSRAQSDNSKSTDRISRPGNRDNLNISIEYIEIYIVKTT
jgi:hypothetical protein